MIKSYIPSKYYQTYWIFKLSVVVSVIISSVYTVLYFQTDLPLIDRIEVIGIVINAILTVALVSLYRNMATVQRDQYGELEERRKIQQEMADIQESQTSIQERQVGIQEKQTKVLRGQNRPKISVSLDRAEDDSLYLTAENTGNGIASSLHVDSICWVFEDQVDEILPKNHNTFWKDEDTNHEVFSDRSVLRLHDLYSDRIDRGKGMVPLRPRGKPDEQLVLKPDSGKIASQVTPDFNFFFDQEYQEMETSDFIETLRQWGLEEVVFQFEVAYRGLSDIEYYEHLVAARVSLSDVSNLEEIIEYQGSGIVLNKRTSEIGYHDVIGSEL